MRIEYLHMKNFAPFFVALDKTDIYLDYRDVKDKVINIMIGQMGTCKTFLLGHHQPFARLGSLDVRDAEDMVLEGKNGLKEIVYSKGDDLFEITHNYTWTGNKHTVKSYVKKNGIELNENGNTSSFTQIIETEFGLDINFLKLFRIGSNVTNLPDMTSSERKAFISSMLTDTEIFAYLYKKIGDENRALNAQMTILTNKLHSISSKTEEDLQADCDAEAEIVKDIQSELDGLNRKLYRIEGAITTLRSGMSEEEYSSHYQEMKEKSAVLDKDIGDLSDKLALLEQIGDPTELNRKVATLSTQISMRKSQILDLDQRIQQDDATRLQLKDQLAIIGSAEHIEQLKKTYTELMQTLTDYERQLRHFKYEGTLTSIMSLISELQALNGLIQDISQYNPDTVKEIIRNPGKAAKSAERQLEHLRAESERLYREMNNIKQGVMYQPTHIMSRPFNCPTPDCPFYKYHPVTEQKRNAGKNVDKMFLERQNKVRELEAEIYRCEEVPNISRKIDIIKKAWSSVMEHALPLGVIKDEDLAEVISNITKRHWYDGDKLQRIKELCGIREKYYELTQSVAAMRNELAQYELSDVTTVEKNLRAVTERLEKEKAELEELEAANIKDTEDYGTLQEAMMQVTQLDVIKGKLHTLKNESKSLHKDIGEIEGNLDSIRAYTSDSNELKMDISRKNTEYRIHSESHDTLIRMISEIKFNKSQFEETLQRQQLVRDVLEAVSSKKGIPLAFVKLFLSDCTGVLNDLISDVFDDSIEIQEFEIPEDGSEFNIPYTRNGVYIGDIVKSSQGERAIISLALSFALIRQGQFAYNIMLLDEVDGPLYKTAREKFITILFKQLNAIQAEQVFIVSHNNTFDGFNVNIIMTSDELVDSSPITTVMRI